MSSCDAAVSYLKEFLTQNSLIGSYCQTLVVVTSDGIRLVIKKPLETLKMLKHLKSSICRRSFLWAALYCRPFLSDEQTCSWHFDCALGFIKEPS